MEYRTNKVPRLNIFALPDQTTVLVAILIAIMFATMVGISANAPIGVFWPLTLALLVLSLRNLLAWPERELWRRGRKTATERHLVVQQRIEELSRELGLRRAPELWIVPDRRFLAQALGGGNRRYILVGAAVADNLADYLAYGGEEEARIVDALLLHELTHFQQGDTLRVGYADSLLRVGLLLIGWAALFLLGWLLFLAIAGREVLSYSPVDIAARFEAAMPGFGIRDLVLLALGSVEEWEAVRARAETLNIGAVLFFAFANTAPIAVISGVLLALLWHKLMRIREFYADAGVAHAQGSITYLLKIARLASKPMDGEAAPVLNSSHSWWAGVAVGFQEHLNHSLIWLGSTWIGKLWRRVFNPHYSQNQREALERPELVFDRGVKRGWLFGFVVLAFELLLTGTSALFYSGSWPMHVPVLVAFALLALALMVDLVIARPNVGEVSRIVAITLVPHTVLLLITLCLLFVGALVAPVYLATFFNSAAALIGGYTGFIPGDLLTRPGEMPGIVLQMAALNLGQPLLMFGVLLAAIEIMRRALGRTLTWYSRFNSTHDWMRVSFLLIGACVFVLAVAVLPPLTELALFRFAWTWWHRIGMILGIIVAASLAFWFIIQDRRYAQRCPRCGAQVPGSYEFGQSCPEGNELLNPWLFAHYEVEPRRHRPRTFARLLAQESPEGIEER